MVGNLLGFLFWIVVTRNYTTSDVGLASTLISVSTIIAMISSLGFGAGIIKYTSAMEKDSVNLLNSFMIIAVFVGSILSCIFLMTVNFLSGELSFLSSSISYKLIFIIVTVCIVLIPLQDSIFIAKRKSGYMIIRSFILGTRIIFPILFVHFEVIGIFSSYGLAYMLSILISTFIFIPKIISEYSLSFTIDKSSIKKTLNFSIGNHIAAFFQNATGLLLPFVITNLLSSEYTAYFYIAWMIATIVYMIPKSIATSLFAELAYDSAEYFCHLLKSIKLILILIIPSIFIFSVFSTNLLVFFGEEYSENSIQILRILLIAALPLGVNEIFYTTWKVKNRTLNLILNNIFIFIFTFLGGYLLMHKYSFLGFGISWCLAQSITAFLNLKTIGYKILQRYMCHRF